jgi:hypothetical protein
MLRGGAFRAAVSAVVAVCACSAEPVRSGPHEQMLTRSISVAVGSSRVTPESKAVTRTATTVTLSNTILPLDQNGNKIITGEAGCLEHNGTFYFYFNDWGTVRHAVRACVCSSS